MLCWQPTSDIQEKFTLCSHTGCPCTLNSRQIINKASCGQTEYNKRRLTKKKVRTFYLNNIVEYKSETFLPHFFHALNSPPVSGSLTQQRPWIILGKWITQYLLNCLLCGTSSPRRKDQHYLYKLKGH